MKRSPVAEWLDRSDDLLCVVDRDGVLVYANRSWARLLACPVEAIVGRSIFSLIDDSAVPTLAAALAGLADGAALMNIETGLTAPDGSGRVISWSSSGRRLEDGNHFLIGRDVTAARAARAAAAHARQTLESVLEQLPDYVTRVDPTGRITFINRTYPGVTVAQVIGTSLYTWLAPADRERFEKGIESVVRSHSAVTLEVEGSGEDGHPSHYRSHIVPYRENGAVVGALIFGRDVSEERRLTRERERVARIDALGSLAGGVSHNFNNVLAAVVCGAEFLRDELAGGELADVAADIAAAAARGVALTRALSWLDKGASPERGVCNLAMEFAAFVPVAQSVLGEGVELTVEGPGAEVAVQATGDDLSRVLLTLVSNAAAALEGRGHVAVRCRLVDVPQDEIVLPAGRYAAIDVSRDGPQIPPSDLDRIFEPFAHDPRGGAHPGVGLAVEYGMLRRFGGELRVSSAPGRDTTFTIFLPVAGERAGAVAPADSGPLSALAGRVVLIAEDQDTLRAPFVRLLRRAGARVLEARDGVDALDCVRRSPEPIGLLLSDLDMPRMGGRALVEALRRDDRVPPTVLMTGGLIPDEQRAWADERGIPLLQKPFTLADLVGAVAKADSRPGGSRAAGS